MGLLLDAQIRYYHRTNIPKDLDGTWNASFTNKRTYLWNSWIITPLDYLQTGLRGLARIPSPALELLLVDVPVCLVMLVTCQKDSDNFRPREHFWSHLKVVEDNLFILFASALGILISPKATQWLNLHYSRFHEKKTPTPGNQTLTSSLPALPALPSASLTQSNTSPVLTPLPET